MTTTVIMRTHDDMPLVTEALAALERQSLAHELIVFDNASSDGTMEALRGRAKKVFPVPRDEYMPGRVINAAMEASESRVVAFLNADCVPLHSDWLEALVAGFADPSVAAVFGRQVPRPEHHPLHRRDTEAAYGNGARQAGWRHWFSMAASAIRRDVWEQERFSEGLRFSEDVEWTWRVRRLGYSVRYVSGAVAMHSHDYTLADFYDRHFGEGRAEALIFDWSPWQSNVLRYALLPLARQMGRDVIGLLAQGEVRATFEAPLYRIAQSLGRRAGFRRGLRERRNGT